MSSYPGSRSAILSPIFALLLIIAAALVVQAAAAVSFPPWTFKPVPSALPGGLSGAFVREIGEQGELFIETTTETGKTYGLVTGGVFTPILAIGQTAPGGGTFADGGDLTAYVASPTLVYITTKVSDGAAEVVRNFRWSSGSLEHLPVAAGVTYDLNRNDAHGRFVARRAVSPTQNEYWITDGLANGTPITLIDRLDISGAAVDGHKQQVAGITADGAFLIHETISSGTIDCVRQGRSGHTPHTPEGITSSTRIFWLGSRSGTLASGNDTNSGCFTNGTVIYAPIVNSAGDVLSQEGTFAASGGNYSSRLTKLVLYPADGSGAMDVAQGQAVNDAGPYFFLQPLALTEWQQPIFRAATDPQRLTEKLFSGPLPGTDAFTGNFDAGFGQDGTPIDLRGFSETGTVLVQARLADNSETLALGSANASAIFKWADPTGGSWNEANNWEPVQVPGANAETVFDLEASYDVNVGTRDTGRVRIENGSVGFTNGALTLLGPLTVGGDAAFNLPSGVLDTGELVVGALPPPDPLSPPTAHVFISNQGTQLTGATDIVIGAAGPGELFLSDAELLSSQVRIGVNAPGAAIAGGSNANWAMTSLAVGSGYTGTLELERGVVAAVEGQATIGHGATEQNYLATLSLDAAGAPLGTHLFLMQGLTVGQKLRGLLEVRNGGLVAVTGDVDMSAIEHSSTQPQHDGAIVLRGEHPTEHHPSKLYVEGDLRMGLDLFNARSHIEVLDGAELAIAGTMTMSVEPGSFSQLVVEGQGAAQSHVTMGTANTGEACFIGDRGESRVFVYAGARFECYFLYLGGQDPQGRGVAVVDRKGSATPATLSAHYQLAIGNDAASDRLGSGRLILRDGAVTAGTLYLFAGSSIEGTGSISVTAADNGIVVLAGTVAPGVNIAANEPPVEPSATAAQARSLAVQPGTLAISGSVTISPSAQITIDLQSVTDYDRLLVDGAVAVAGGTLTLAFGNGYAPKQGETFAFLQADSVAGAFSKTEIAGLAPGFEYQFETVNGALVLVALNNGVATSQGSYGIHLPLVVR